MAAVLVDAAEAVKTGLNSASLSQSFRAERSYADWDMELEDIDTLRVDVVPVAHEDSDLADRGHIAYECAIDVGIRKRFSQDDQAMSGRVATDEVDALVLLVEDVVELFAGKVLTDFTSGIWHEAEVRASFNRAHLRELRQFTGIVRLPFDVEKALS